MKGENRFPEAKKTEMDEGVLEKEVEKILYESLMEEVSTTPKPGLVDLHDSGAHTDMNYYTFLQSARSITPYLAKMFQTGCSWQGTPAQLFAKIRPIGREAEAAMFWATEGINTHKGAIFTLGILSAAAGAVYRPGQRLCAELICAYAGEMTRETLQRELEAMKLRTPVTNGEWIFRKYGASGVRGLAADGFSLLLEVAMPYMRLYRRCAIDCNEANINVLLKIMAVLCDTNVLHRTSMAELCWMQSRAAALLRCGGAFGKAGMCKIGKFNRECIERNVSPGGAADLLAASIFLWRLEQL